MGYYIPRATGIRDRRRLFPAQLEIVHPSSFFRWDNSFCCLLSFLFGPSTCHDQTFQHGKPTLADPNLLEPFPIMPRMDFPHFLVVEQPESGFLADHVPYVFPVLIAILLALQIEPEQILIALSFGFDGERK